MKILFNTLKQEDQGRTLVKAYWTAQLAGGREKRGVSIVAPDEDNGRDCFLAVIGDETELIYLDEKEEGETMETLTTDTEITNEERAAYEQHKEIMTSTSEHRIYVADLAAYNEGLLAGKWIDLPSYDITDEVEEMLEETSEERAKYLGYEDAEAMEEDGIYHSEEWAIHDYEGFEFYGKVSEYENLEDLNEAVEEYENLDDQDQKKLEFLMDAQGYDLQGALSNLENCDIYEDMDFKDLAYMFVDEGLMGDIPESMQNYFDYDQLAYDLQFDYTEHNGSIFRCN